MIRLTLPCLLLVLLGCRPPGDPTDGRLTPPVIRVGQDTSYPDGRPIEDGRFVASLVTATGEVRRFDDIGRLPAQVADPAEPVAAAWVYDYETAEPVAAQAAFYVGSLNLVTPRGSGLLAVSTADRARVLANLNAGQVLAWEELPGYLIAARDAPLFPAAGGSTGGLLEAER